MAARVVLFDKKEQRRVHCFTVDAKEILEADRKAVRQDKQKEPRYEIDRQARPDPPPTEDQKIAQQLEEEQRRDDRRAGEAAALADHTAAPSVGEEPSEFPDDLSE